MRFGVFRSDHCWQSYREIFSWKTSPYFTFWWGFILLMHATQLLGIVSVRNIWENTPKLLPYWQKGISRGNHKPRSSSWTSSPFLQDRNLPRNKDWDGKRIWLKSWGRSHGWLLFRARCRLEGGAWGWGTVPLSARVSLQVFGADAGQPALAVWGGWASTLLCSTTEHGTCARAPSPAWTPVWKCARWETTERCSSPAWCLHLQAFGDKN